MLFHWIQVAEIIHITGHFYMFKWIIVSPFTKNTTLCHKVREKAGRESRSWFCFEKLLVLWISLCSSTALWGRAASLMRLRAEIVHKSGRGHSRWFVTCFTYLVGSGVEMLLIFWFWGARGGVADWHVEAFPPVTTALWAGVCLSNNLCIILWVVRAFSHSSFDGSVLQGKWWVPVTK